MKKSTNATYETIHSNNVTELKKQLGHKPLTDRDIRNVCTGKNFLGVFMQDSPIPAKNDTFIINTDYMHRSGIHWMSGIIRNKNVYLYDSFGRHARNILPSFTHTMIARGYKIHNADLSDQDQYGNSSVDCGHRCISSLRIYAKYGLRAFMKL
jgi:hypothetical protein